MSPLEEAITATLRRKRAEGVMNPTDCACTVMQTLALENPAEWAKIRDELALDAIAGKIHRELTHIASKTDLRQGLLALPGYEQVPQLIEVDGGLADIREVTLEQFRESESELRTRIKSWSYARVSPGRLKRAKARLAQMSKVDRKSAPLLANLPDAKMGLALDQIQAALETPRAKHNREVAAAGGRAKKRRTKNQ